MAMPTLQHIVFLEEFLVQRCPAHRASARVRLKAGGDSHALTFGWKARQEMQCVVNEMKTSLTRIFIQVCLDYNRKIYNELSDKDLDIVAQCGNCSLDIADFVYFSVESNSSFFGNKARTLSKRNDSNKGVLLII